MWKCTGMDLDGPLTGQGWKYDVHYILELLSRTWCNCVMHHHKSPRSSGIQGGATATADP